MSAVEVRHVLTRPGLPPDAVVADAAHLCNDERPAEVNAAVGPVLA